MMWLLLWLIRDVNILPPTPIDGQHTDAITGVIGITRLEEHRERFDCQARNPERAGGQVEERETVRQADREVEPSPLWVTQAQ